MVMEFVFGPDKTQFKVGNVMWVTDDNGTMFLPHYTGVTRRLNFEGDRESFFLGVTGRGISGEVIVGVFNTHEAAYKAQDELDKWLQDADAQRKQRFYVDCFVCAEHEGGKQLEVQAVNGGERYLVQYDLAVFPRVISANSTFSIAKSCLQNVSKEQEKRDELDEVCAKLLSESDDDTVGETLRHDGPGEMLYPTGCCASSSAASSTSKPEPESNEKKEAQNHAVQFLKAFVFKKQAAIILNSIETRTGHAVDFCGDERRQEFLDKLTTEIDESMCRFDNHYTWTKHCINFAVELVKKMTNISRDADIVANMISECAREVFAEVEEELSKNTPIYKSNKQRKDAFKQVAAKMCELLNENATPKDEMSSVMIKFTRELLERIQKENNEEYKKVKLAFAKSLFAALESEDEDFISVLRANMN